MGTFDGRSFVEAPGSPAGESPSPSDGKDEAPEAGGSEDGLSADDKPDQGDEDRGGEGQGDGAPEAKTFWDQTPEEKRAERFNHAMERDNAREAELRALREENERYKKGGGKPAEPIPEPEADAPGIEEEGTLSSRIFSDALNPQVEVEKLTPNQKTIRRLNDEVVTLHQTTVAPAEAKYKAAVEAYGKAEVAYQRKQTLIEGLREMAQGNEGLYESQIEEAERALVKLENTLVRADTARTNARLDLRDASDAYSIRQGANREKAFALSRADARKRNETVSQSKYEKQYKEQEDALLKEWDDSLKAVFTETKLPAKLHKGAAAIAFRDVEDIAAARGDKNPVTPAEFKKLIKEAIGPLLESVSLDADPAVTEAERRSAAADQPGPQNRTAKGNAKPQSKDEAWDQVKQGLRSFRQAQRTA